MSERFLYNSESSKQFRRILRKDSTDAEQKLWARLRRKQILGLRFLRQYGVGGFILDFYCPAKRLAIEVDGGQHAINIDTDAARTRFLQNENIRVERFWNNDVLTNIEGVMQQILNIIQSNPS